ncbi:MAG: lipocalin-like domain-containing protein [Anaerolineales bacterium]
MRRPIIWLSLLIVLAAITAAALLLRPAAESEQLAAQVLTTPAAIDGFTRADGSWPVLFPQDFGPHFDYRTEWWYYTGNLDTADGRHFGYELTFFRAALLPPDQVFPRQSEWAINQIYMAHFALTDVEGGVFHAFQRYARGAAGLAGAQADPYQVWLEDWRVEQSGDYAYSLHASNEGISIDLHLTDDKGPVLHGDQGYSQKGRETGNASYYYSQTRLLTEGTIQIGGEELAVSGLSWKDHEYSTSVLSAGQVGWDWFAIQLDGGYELMLYQIRRGDGSVDAFSSGTLIGPDGSAQALSRDDFIIESQNTWRSPHSDAVYPMGWTISVPSADLQLTLSPYLVDQELNLATIYWEGAVNIIGTHRDRAITGVGYVEMTGYAEPFNGDF